KLPMISGNSAFGNVSNGAYLLIESKDAKITLMASGSEVGIALDAAKKLDGFGIKTNVVSVPCLDLFNEQDSTYKSRVIDANTKVLAIEASSAVEYWRYADDVLCMEGFGASAPAELLFEKFGFTADNIVNRACKLIGV
ncbi:MAG: transketolase C-terminal domain-containing protein, partial [Sulfurovaceae bacterium]|nr:transketolase C-terminal domain-containing protein [Sulfurovaceae bacterium]